MRLFAPLMVPIAAAGECLRVIAGGKPFLGQVSEAQVVRCVATSHLRWDPARIDRITEDVGVQPRNGCCECGYKEFAVRIAACGGAARPVQSRQAGSSPLCMLLLR